MMPSDQRVRLDDSRDRTPVEEPWQQHEDDARGRNGLLWLYPAFLIERELFAQEGSPRQASEGDG